VLLSKTSFPHKEPGPDDLPLTRNHDPLPCPIDPKSAPITLPLTVNVSCFLRDCLLDKQCVFYATIGSGGGRMETGRRIPIFTGFSIEISRDERPLSYGLEEEHVIAGVELWLRGSRNHPDLPTVARWLQLKMAADEEDSRVQAIRKKRQDAYAEVDKIIPKKLAKALGPEFKKLARRKITEHRGIPDENKE
jgi:hypothetical protein